MIDPFIVTYEYKSEKWAEISRSEIIWNTSEPNWCKTVRIDYFFEISQQIRFEIFDAKDEHESHRNILDRLDFLGGFETTVADMVQNNLVTGDLFDGNGTCQKNMDNTACYVSGQMTIRVEEVIDSNEVITLKFKASKLDKKDFFGRSDPFLKISKPTPVSGGWEQVFQTNIVKFDLNPAWAKIVVKFTDLCNGYHEKQLKLEVFDWNANQQHKLIGFCVTSLASLLINPFQTWELINPKKLAKKKKRYKHSGILHLTYSKTEKLHTFFEFLNGGMQMLFEIGIDFTQSNGVINDSSSKHFIDPVRLNEYQIAIKSIGEIMQAYSALKKLCPVQNLFIFEVF